MKNFLACVMLFSYSFLAAALTPEERQLERWVQTHLHEATQMIYCSDPFPLSTTKFNFGVLQFEENGAITHICYAAKNGCFGGDYLALGRCQLIEYNDFQSSTLFLIGNFFRPVPVATKSSEYLIADSGRRFFQFLDRATPPSHPPVSRSAGKEYFPLDCKISSKLAYKHAASIALKGINFSTTPPTSNLFSFALFSKSDAVLAEEEARVLIQAGLQKVRQEMGLSKNAAEVRNKLLYIGWDMKFSLEKRQHPRFREIGQKFVDEVTELTGNWTWSSHPTELSAEQKNNLEELLQKYEK